MATWRFLTTSRLCAARPARRRRRSPNAPGQRLPSVVTLMQEYGAAHLTAIMALRLLVTEALAEVSPGLGFYVRTDIRQS